MKRFIALVLVVLALRADAQDLHFSHFYNSPLSLNPALTGLFGGCYRFGLNYRTQWRSITVPYKTFSAYVDGGAEDVGPLNKLAVGGVLLHDNAGDGHLRTTRAQLSIALHKTFGGHLSIALGANGGFTQKKLDFGLLTFDDQWTGSSFDPSVATQEPGSTDPVAYYDVQAGAVISWRTNEDDIYFLGFSGVHIVRPLESFYNQANQVGFRPVIHGGAFLNITPQLVAEPSFLYMSQKGAQEFLIGGNVSRLMIGPLDYILGGIWFRGTGDAIPVVGGSYRQVHFLMSYDINVSSLTPATHLRGGLELSMKFIVPCGDKMPEVIVVPCIRI